MMVKLMTWPVLLLFSLASCSEARSDIENLENKQLQEQAKSLSESADKNVDEQVKQIQSLDTTPTASKDSEENIINN